MEKQIRVFLIILFMFLFILNLVSGQTRVIQYDEEKQYYTCPKYKAEDIGIKYPYQVAYRWEASYIHPTKHKIVRFYENKAGENNNYIISPYRLMEIKVQITSFYRSENYFTGLIYDEFSWNQKQFEAKTVEPINIKPLEVQFK